MPSPGCAESGGATRTPELSNRRSRFVLALFVSTFATMGEPTITKDDLSARERATFARLSRAARRESRRSVVATSRERRRASATTGRSCRFRRGFIGFLAAIVVGAVLIPPYLIPVDGVTTSRFFLRNAPDSPRLVDFEHHTGLDIAAPTGTRVVASRSGRVIAAGTLGNYGTYIDIRHPLGWVTRYAHLSATMVTPGRWVWRGAKIGEVGETGRATGPHLHFEVRVADRAVPPGIVLVFHGVRRTLVRAVRGR